MGKPQEVRNPAVVEPGFTTTTAGTRKEVIVPTEAGAPKANEYSLKEVLASKFIHKLVGGAPGRVGYVLADRIVATLLRAMVGRERGGGSSERENEGSESAEHVVVRLSRMRWRRFGSL